MSIQILFLVSFGLRGGFDNRSLAGIAGSNFTDGMDVCCECCVLSNGHLFIGLITLPEESYRAWCVSVWQ
jgi:hypothetical protein